MLDLIRIEGWYPKPRPKDSKNNEKEDWVDYQSTFLGPDFIYGCRDHEISRLAILPMKRLAGNLFSSVWVRGITDTKGSLVPFFIDEEKVERLQRLINKYTDSITVL